MRTLLWLGAIAAWSSAVLLIPTARLAGPVQNDPSPELTTTLLAAYLLVFASMSTSVVLAAVLWRVGLMRALAQAFFALIASYGLWIVASVQTTILELDYAPHHGAYIGMGLALIVAPVAAGISAALAGWVGRKSAMPFWVSAVGIAAGLFGVGNLIVYMANAQSPPVPWKVWMSGLGAILFVWWIGAGWFMARLTFKSPNP